MRHTITHRAPVAAPPISPLQLSDQLLTLAEQAGQAGYQDAACRLLRLAQRMLLQPPLTRLAVSAQPIAVGRPASASQRRHR